MEVVHTPFLTRFFRALADDIRLPDTSPPIRECIGNGMCADPDEEKNTEKSDQGRT